jgi:NAD(P)-dependent dehydrogenase (short-subunit alcohol dehydrogenase family)
MATTESDYYELLGVSRAAAGGAALEVPADIGDRAQVEAAFKLIHERLGAPEVLLYNGGLTVQLDDGEVGTNPGPCNRHRCSLHLLQFRFGLQDIGHVRMSASAN